MRTASKIQNENVDRDLSRQEGFVMDVNGELVTYIMRATTGVRSG